MRPLDLAAIGLTLATCMLVVQATWTPPAVGVDAVGDHVGERVRVEGMVLELRRYDEVSRFVLVADGAAVHARAERVTLADDQWVQVTGTIDREGGRPLLRVETIEASRAVADHADLVSVGLDPAAHADHHIRLQGHLDRGTLEGKGLALRTTASGSGAATLQGVLRYEARCVCYIFHVDPAWTRS